MTCYSSLVSLEASLAVVLSVWLYLKQKCSEGKVGFETMDSLRLGGFLSPLRTIFVTHVERGFCFSEFCLVEDMEIYGIPTPPVPPKEMSYSQKASASIWEIYFWSTCLEVHPSIWLVFNFPEKQGYGKDC